MRLQKKITVNLCLNFIRLEYRVDDKDIYQVVTDQIILEKGNFVENQQIIVKNIYIFNLSNSELGIR